MSGTTRAQWSRPSDAEPLGDAPMLTTSEAVHILPGHPLRGSACIVCTRPIGGALVILCQSAELRDPDWHAAGLHACAGLIHATCESAGDRKILERLHSRACAYCQAKAV